MEADAAFLLMLGNRLHALQHLDAGLSLLCFRCFGAEPGDELLDLGAAGILFDAEFLILLQAHPPDGFKIVVSAAAIERELAVLEMKDLIDRAVQEAAIVTDQNNRPGIVLEVILKPDRGFEIEM